MSLAPSLLMSKHPYDCFFKGKLIRENVVLNMTKSVEQIGRGICFKSVVEKFLQHHPRPKEGQFLRSNHGGDTRFRIPAQIRFVFTHRE